MSNLFESQDPVITLKLIESGSDVNAVDNDLKTALMYSQNAENKSKLELILIMSMKMIEQL